MFKQNHTFIVCELAQTHEGDFSLAKLLVKAAALSKADAVKFQTFAADELAAPGYKYYSLFQKLEWPESYWKELIDLGHTLGIKVYADVFGVKSLKMLISLYIDGLKLHATDIRNPILLSALSEVDLPLIVSVGGCSLDEVKKALGILERNKRQHPIILMHGFQSYPTLIEHSNLNKLKLFQDTFLKPVGYADHIDGNHPHNFSLCAMAIGMGAVVIEKHLTIARLLKLEDYESALNPDDFAQFVLKIREVDLALGESKDHLSSSEVAYRQMIRKHVVAIREITQGDLFKDTDLALKRVDSIDEPLDLSDVIGKKAPKNYLINDPVLRKDLLR